MPLIDIIDFNSNQLRHQPEFYGFDSFLYLGKDVTMHPTKGKSSSSPQTGKPSIVFSHNTEELIHSIKKFDIIYSTIYDASPALLSRVSVEKKKVLINISDILNKNGTERSKLLHRISRFLDFCRSYKAEFIFASLAKDEFSIRSPQEVSDILISLGTEREQTRYSYSILSDILHTVKR